MPNFAVIDGEIIINTIVAESKQIAEEVTGKTCVEFTNEFAEINGTYKNGVFYRKKPYESWVLNDNSEWVPPIEYPTLEPDNPKYYTWDESKVAWVEL